MDEQHRVRVLRIMGLGQIIVSTAFAAYFVVYGVSNLGSVLVLGELGLLLWACRTLAPIRASASDQVS